MKLSPTKGKPGEEMPNIMQGSPIPKRLAGANRPEQPIRKHDRDSQEVARLRRLADVRAVVHPSGHQQMPPKSSLQQLSANAASTPDLRAGGESNAQDFASRTHLARLDIAYEKLDTYVEQSVEQLLSAMNEQRKTLEDWIDKKIGASEKKLEKAVATVQQTRSVLDSAVSSLTATGKQGGNAPLDAGLQAKLTSIEERLKSSEERLNSQRDASSSGSPPKGVDMTRLSQLEEKMNTVEDAISKVARTSSDNSVSKDMNSRIFDARTDSLQSAVSDLGVQLEALRNGELKQSGPQAQDKIGLEERFAALQAQLTSAAASHTALESALAAVAERQRTAEDRAQGEETAYQLDSQAEELRVVQNQLQEQAIRSAGLQALMEEKVAALDEKLKVNDPEALFAKNGKEVQDLKWRHESFATNLDQLARRVQTMLEQSGGVDAQISELRSKIDQTASPEEMFRGRVSEEVQSGLANYFNTPAKSGSLSASGSPLARLEAVEEELRHTANAVTAVEAKLPGYVSQADFFKLRVRVEGGFDALVVQLEADRWMEEECGFAGDKIFQAFTFNLDNRITDVEHRLHKSDALVDKLMEKNHMKVRKTAHMPSHCIKCGSTFAADVDFCRKCGTTKKGTKLQMLVPKRAVRAAQEHNFTLLKVTFDVWARRDNADCFRDLAARQSAVVVMPAIKHSDSSPLLDCVSEPFLLTRDSTRRMSRVPSSTSPIMGTPTRGGTPTRSVIDRSPVGGLDMVSPSRRGTLSSESQRASRSPAAF